MSRAKRAKRTAELFEAVKPYPEITVYAFSDVHLRVIGPAATIDYWPGKSTAHAKGMAKGQLFAPIEVVNFVRGLHRPTAPGIPTVGAPGQPFV
jgi:hypothetical protein